MRRWQLEGGSRKRGSSSKILERRWRYTLQEKPPRRGKTLTPPLPQPVHSISLHSKWRNQRAPCSQSPAPILLGKSRPPRELSGTQYSHKRPWARSAQPPGHTDPHPGKKEKKQNWIKNKQLNKKKRHVAKRAGRPELQRVEPAGEGRSGATSPSGLGERKACNRGCHVESSTREWARATPHAN
jgi:hypothetical protein